MKKLSTIIALAIVSTFTFTSCEKSAILPVNASNYSKNDFVPSTKNQATRMPNDEIGIIKPSTNTNASGLAPAFADTTTATPVGKKPIIKSQELEPLSQI